MNQIHLSNLPDFCLVAEPHAMYYVPETQGLPYLVATSGSGAYYYGTLCKAFIVDIKMATYSNTDPYKEGLANPTGALYIAAGPYDLPSSATFGGNIPTVEEDCKRLKVWARYYLKRSNEDHFTKTGQFHTTTNWQAGTNFCAVQFEGIHGITAFKSQAGWDTYRVAVGTLLRSSAQEVAVNLIATPPG